MRDIKVASRYAKSLLKIAIEEKALEELYTDMQLVNKICAENRELVLLLKSPVVKSDKKQAILTAIFDKNLSKIAATFVSLITNKKRAGILDDIAASFIETYKQHKNIKTAQVTSAVALSKAQKDGIIAILNSAKDASSIDLHEVIDTNIIGGMILRVGDKQVDESIKRKLKNLEMEFDENPYVKEY
jgi:F-type H+-transporting ATPase subunit delta